MQGRVTRVPGGHCASRVCFALRSKHAGKRQPQGRHVCTAPESSQSAWRVLMLHAHPQDSPPTCSSTAQLLLTQCQPASDLTDQHPARPPAAARCRPRCAPEWQPSAATCTPPCRAGCTGSPAPAAGAACLQGGCPGRVGQGSGDRQPAHAGCQPHQSLARSRHTPVASPLRAAGSGPLRSRGGTPAASPCSPHQPCPHCTRTHPTCKPFVCGPVERRAAIRVQGIGVSAPLERQVVQDGCLAVLRCHVAHSVAPAAGGGSSA